MSAIVFDFDGVLHKHAYWMPAFGELDFSPMREALRKGFPVAISTCNDVRAVAHAVRQAGFKVLADVDMRHGQLGWDGGRDGRLVLITNRKVSGYIVDDRAFNYHYGEPTRPLWDQIEAAEADRKARRSAA